MIPIRDDQPRFVEIGWGERSPVDRDAGGCGSRGGALDMRVDVGRHDADVRARRKELIELRRGDGTAADEQHPSPGERQKERQQCRHRQ